jgi:hypothetical protein
MRYRFQDPMPAMYACKAIDLLINFYVAQSDGIATSLNDTERFDLLVFTLGTQQKNDQLKTVVAEVVKNRLNARKPTWIFLPTPTLDGCVQEKSPELEELLKLYKTVTIAGNGQGPILTQAKKSAANFSMG